LRRKQRKFIAVIKPISLLKQETLEEEVQRFHEWQEYYQKEIDALLYKQKCELDTKHEIIAKLISESALERETRLNDEFSCKCHDFRIIGDLHNELLVEEKWREKVMHIVNGWGEE